MVEDIRVEPAVHLSNPRGRAGKVPLSPRDGPPGPWLTAGEAAAHLRPTGPQAAYNLDADVGGSTVPGSRRGAVIENALAFMLAAQLAPFGVEVRRLAAEVEHLRRALPPMLVTLPEAATVLGVSLSTVRRRARDGSLPVHRLGRTLRVDLMALRPPPEEEVTRLAGELRLAGGSR